MPRINHSSVEIERPLGAQRVDPKFKGSQCLLLLVCIFYWLVIQPVHRTHETPSWFRLHLQNLWFRLDLQNRPKELLERPVSAVDVKGWINYFLDRQSIETRHENRAEFFHARPSPRYPLNHTRDALTTLLKHHASGGCERLVV